MPRSDGSPEGDGWILAIINRLDENRGELAVLDALDIGKGPVATYALPVRVRSTFHGIWVPEETFATKKVPNEDDSALRESAIGFQSGPYLYTQ